MIENQLQEWGTAQRQSPTNNQVKKHQLMAKFLPIAGKQPKSFGFPWLSLAFASLAVVVFIVSASQNFSKQISFNATLGQPEQNQSSAKISGGLLGSTPLDSNQNQIISNNQGALASPPAADKFNSASKSDYLTQPLKTAPPESSRVIMPYQNPEVPITDNRELLKTSYSATVKSRQILQTAESVQTIIRGFKGRVDSSSVSKGYAYINFAMPQEKLEQFRLELKNFAGVRFVLESTQAQNMLPQKQNLEQENTDAQNQLNELRNNLDQLTANHNHIINTLKSQLFLAKQELADLQSKSAGDVSFALATQARQEELQKQVVSLNNQTASENSSYQNNLIHQNEQIKQQTNYIANIQKQDSNLLDSVATVQGAIVFQQINLLEFVNAYISVYWIVLALALGAFASYYFGRPKMLDLPRG